MMSLFEAEAYKDKESMRVPSVREKQDLKLSQNYLGDDDFEHHFDHEADFFRDEADTVEVQDVPQVSNQFAEDEAQESTELQTEEPHEPTDLPKESSKSQADENLTEAQLDATEELIEPQTDEPQESV